MTGEIPNIAPGSAQLLMKLMDGDNGVQDVLDTIKQFATIVGKLISLANSVLSNPVSAVTTLDGACTRLGLDVVRTVATALVVGRSFNVSSCPGFDRVRFWASSIITSQTAAVLAPRFEVDAPSARTAGLLHNIGLLWLADCLPEETNAALLMAEDDALAQLEIEVGLDGYLERLAGISYRTAGLRLLTHWQLPDILTAGLGALEDPDEDDLRDTMSTVVRYSAHIASSVCAGKETIRWEDDVQQEGMLDIVFKDQQSKLSRTLD
ncbi:MAG: HDOD domain-containing protein, partial [Gammaproteobacteria bacterium]|nr:HDOD domain-containing protein [Gammaproteobacteria bacterium]